MIQSQKQAEAVKQSEWVKEAANRKELHLSRENLPWAVGVHCVKGGQRTVGSFYGDRTLTQPPESSLPCGELPGSRGRCR